MQYYTKQQLQGAGRYSAKCRVGNWNEDVEMQEVDLKDYISRKKQASLSMDTFGTRMAAALTEVSTETVAGDPVKFGAKLQLGSVSSSQMLSIDTKARDSRPGMNACSVSASSYSTPCVRNTWVFKKHEGPPIPNKDDSLRFPDRAVVCYGNKVVIVGADGHALRSRPASTLHAAKQRGLQEVQATDAGAGSYDCVWEILTPDPSKRLVSAGVEVLAGVPFLLVHCATGAPLCCGGPMQNDFGEESEVCAGAVTSQRVVHAMRNLVRDATNDKYESVVQNPNLWCAC